MLCNLAVNCLKLKQRNIKKNRPNDVVLHWLIARECQRDICLKWVNIFIKKDNFPRNIDVESKLPIY